MVRFLKLAFFVLCLAVTYRLLRMYVAGGVCISKARMIGKTVIITGANTGIGKETAMDLAKRGARVIMACRDLKKGEVAKKEIVERTGSTTVILKHLNLASMRSIREFAEDINKNEPEMNVLINNAGVAYMPDLRKTEDGFEMTIGVNHLGHFLLTNLLLDLLKRSRAARIVVVSSVGHMWFYSKTSLDFGNINSEIYYDQYESYGQSKLANILFTRELTKRLKGTNVTVNSLHPGLIMTELGRHVTNPLYTLIGKAILTCLFKTPEEGAQTSIHLAVSEELEGVSGLYFSDCKPKETSKAAQDDEVAKKLWEVSADLVGTGND